jgi:hypothetical protein
VGLWPDGLLGRRHDCLGFSSADRGPCPTDNHLTLLTSRFGLRSERTVAQRSTGFQSLDDRCAVAPVCLIASIHASAYPPVRRRFAGGDEQKECHHGVSSEQHV